MPDQESTEIEQFKQQVTNRVAEEYFPELFAELEEKIIKRMDNWLGEKLPGQMVTYDFNMNFEIDDNNSIGYIEVDFSPITGEHEVQVRTHTRNGRQVQGHSRTLTDQATFELEDGSVITSDRIPDEILIKEIIYPVIQEYSDDTLADVKDLISGSEGS